jgi:hypothetical protein
MASRPGIPIISRYSLRLLRKFTNTSLRIMESVHSRGLIADSQRQKQKNYGSNPWGEDWIIRKAFLCHRGHRELELPDSQDEAHPRLEMPPSINEPELRPYQCAAVTSWELADRKGIIALPTGSGKTRTSIAAISRNRLRTLCLVPARVPMTRWAKMLEEASIEPKSGAQAS